MTGQAVVLASGGMDSATAIAVAQDLGYDVHLIHVSYGQNTQQKEVECAFQQGRHFDVEAFAHIDMSHFLTIGGSSLTQESMEVEDVNFDSEEVPNSYVPFRNANLLSMAVSYAEVNDCERIFIGAHSEDYSGYPDCRPQFFDAFQQTIDTGTKDDSEVILTTPFERWSKTEIVRRGMELAVPFELTWSCYRDKGPACGTCDACAYRLKAFQDIGERDPIEYAERPEYV